MPRRARAGKAAASCAGCLSWGVLEGRYCRACYDFGQRHDQGACGACHRLAALKKGHCRLCWLQAAAHAPADAAVGLRDLEQVRHQQLSFAGMNRIGRPGPRSAARPASTPAPGGALSGPPDPASGWTQPQLPAPVGLGHLGHFGQRRWWAAKITNPRLDHARRIARKLGETRGWTARVAAEVDRALAILLADPDQDSDKVIYSQMFPVLRARDISVERAAEILDLASLLDDDRVPAFESWLQRRLTGLAPGIAHGAEDWLRTLHDGGPRARPRSAATIWRYLNRVHSVLAGWSTRYAHLREVTAADVAAATASLQGSSRHQTLTALRSLFGHCKKTGVIFADPAARIRAGERETGVILPLHSADIGEAVAAATTPAARLALVLAAVHAARPKAIRELHLDDLDLGNRRLIIAGHARPLDDLTRQVILDWLAHRRTRWPATANPHLIVNQQTALGVRPVGAVWITESLRGLTATHEALRVDRQLDEALTRGGDPLHLAAVFGVDEETAIRYAHAARALLESPAERHNHRPTPRTQGPDPPTGPEDP